MADQREELIELIAEEALVDKDKLVDSATLSDIGLDSVGVVSVVFAVEEKYGVEIGEEAFKDVADFGGFLAVIEAAIAAKPAA
ncbi:MAG TPA: phosphopantetheine-binding protein [Caulobacteraceae bacterium]|jgi:acyl carrier protein|nr:phosphopantetheine-binding protein [Caulobacteraceae bacterium]